MNDKQYVSVIQYLTEQGYTSDKYSLQKINQVYFVGKSFVSMELIMITCLNTFEVKFFNPFLMCKHLNL